MVVIRGDDVGSSRLRNSGCDRGHRQARGAGQPKVGGHERGAALLGQDDVEAVGDRQVASALPGEREEWSHLGPVDRCAREALEGIRLLELE